MFLNRIGYHDLCIFVLILLIWVILVITVMLYIWFTEGLVLSFNHWVSVMAVMWYCVILFRHTARMALGVVEEHPKVSIPQF